MLCGGEVVSCVKVISFVEVRWYVCCVEVR